MECMSFKGKKGQEIIISNTDLELRKDGQYVKAYPFSQYQICVRESATGVSAGAAAFGLVGAVVATAITTAKYHLEIVDSNGEIEKVNLHLQKELTEGLEKRIQESARIMQRERAQRLQEAGGQHTYKFGEIRLLWFSLILVLAAILYTVVATKNKKITMGTIVLEPDSLTINGKVFNTLLIANLQVSPIDGKSFAPEIKFRYDGRDYKYRINSNAEDARLNVPYANLQYQELHACLRIMFEDKPEVMVSGF